LLHWQGKFRGPDFAPISFKLETVTHERLKDSKGRQITTVIAKPISEQAKEEMGKVSRSNENLVLAAIRDHQDASLAELARHVGWTFGNGEPNKMKVARAISKLKKWKYVEDDRGTYTLLHKGERALERDT
jgi:hypothetical protein